MNTKEIKEVTNFLLGLKCLYLDSGCRSYARIIVDCINSLQRGHILKEKLIIFLEKENPYPEDVFLPIPKEDFDKINDFLKKEMGYSIDRLSGNMGRKLYKSIIEILKEVIK